MHTLSILKYPWHTAHDYELAKLPHRFFYLTNTPREWAVQHRPIPGNITWVARAEDVETDVMILHLDQWSYFEPSKRHLFLTLKRAYAGPKIIINHGCNMLDGYSSSVARELADGCSMVCNSTTAMKLWDVPGSRFIRHGMTPDEWPSTDYGHNNIVVVQHYSMKHKEFRNLAGVEEAERAVDLTWVGRDISFDSFAAYRHFLGHSSVFFNPSYASPNPRARSEAMLSGLAVVTTNSHGEAEYIENGVNGFASNDFGELVDALVFLKRNPEAAKRVGQAGRRTAREIFHIDRFVEQWNRLLEDVLSHSGRLRGSAG